MLPRIVIPERSEDRQFAVRWTYHFALDAKRDYARTSARAPVLRSA